MTENKEWVYQLSLKVNGHLLNARAFNKEEFKQRILDTLELSKLLVPEKINSMVDITNAGKKEVDSWNLPETILDKDNNICSHKNTREISGTGKYGPWKGLICKDCNSANFQRNHKEDGSVSYKGWEPPKIQQEKIYGR